MKQLQSTALSTALLLTGTIFSFTLTISTSQATELRMPITTVAQYDAMNMRTLYDEALVGNLKSQFHLARRLHKGIGVSQNLVSAIQWYQLAAEGGATPAQLNLGLMYARRGGIKEDEAKARFWLEKAVMGGDNRASYFLAVLDEKQNKLIDAYKWYHLASGDDMLSDLIKNKARSKIGQLAMNLSSEDINNAHSLAESWRHNH